MTVPSSEGEGKRAETHAPTGCCEWRPAGRGIIHQEMPRGDAVGRMHGFQLWANLPARHKMTVPRYQELKAEQIPTLTEDDGTVARLICGHFWGKRGPVEGIAADPTYVDISVPAGKTKVLPVAITSHAFAYVFAGSGVFANASPPQPVSTELVAENSLLDTQPLTTLADNRSMVLFDSGDEVRVTAGEQGIRFLLISGKPLQEPVAWRGPIVMNTQEELRQAYAELQKGTFLKTGT